MSEDKNFVSESIVKLIFDQTKATADANSAALKDISLSFHELAKASSNFPTKNDIEKMSEKAEERLSDKIEVVSECSDDVIKKMGEFEKTLDAVKEGITRVEKTTEENKKNIGILDGRVTKVLIVISVAFGLFLGIFAFVNKSMDTLIEEKMKDAVEYIIKTRGVQNPPPFDPNTSNKK